MPSSAAAPNRSRRPPGGVRPPVGRLPAARLRQGTVLHALDEPAAAIATPMPASASALPGVKRPRDITIGGPLGELLERARRRTLQIIATSRVG